MTLLNNLDVLFDGDPNTSLVDAILDDFFPSRNPATPMDKQIKESLINDQGFIDDLVTATQGAEVVAPVSLDELEDVDTSGMMENDVLRYNGTSWVPEQVDAPVVVTGCMDSEATNYNADATEDDGSCEYDSGNPDNPLYFGGNCSDTQYNNKCSCESNGETWTPDTTGGSTSTFEGAGVFNTTQLPTNLGITAQLPQVNAIDVPTTGSFFFTFDNNSLYAPLSLGMGNIDIKRTDGTLHLSIPVSSCTIHNNVLEIPVTDRDRMTDYYILMDEGVVEYCGVLSAPITQASATIHTTQGKFQDISPYGVPSNSINTAADLSLTNFSTANILGIDQITLEFNSILQPGTGNIGIYEVEDGINQGVVQEFTIAQCRIVDSIVISPIFTPLALEKSFCVLIDAGAVTHDNTATGNCGITPVPFIGVTDITELPVTTGQTFTLIRVDYIDDAEDDNVEVPIRTEFNLEFSREIYLNCGAVRIYKADGTLVQELNINTNFQEMGTYGIISKTSANVITINPTVYFEYNEDYYIQADAELVRDAYFSYWEGISDTSYSFTTIKGPTILGSSSLGDGKTGILMEYDRPLTAGTGQAHVYASDGTLVESIPVTDSKITIEN